METQKAPPNTPETQRDWQTLAEWAQDNGFSLHGAQNMARRGDIPGLMKFGSRYRVSRLAFNRAFHGDAQVSK